jgi:hypothetical protein
MRKENRMAGSSACSGTKESRCSSIISHVDGKGEQQDDRGGSSVRRDVQAGPQSTPASMNVGDDIFARNANLHKELVERGRLVGNRGDITIGSDEHPLAG